MEITENIIEIVRKHIDTLNENLIEIDGFCYKYGFKLCKDFFESYYFDYEILNCDNSNKKIPELAGAPGFIVFKDTLRVQVITFGELNELYREEYRKEKLLNLLYQIKNQKLSIFDLKKVITINTDELLKLKKIIELDKMDDFQLNIFYQSLDEDSKKIFDS